MKRAHVVVVVLLAALCGLVLLWAEAMRRHSAAQDLLAAATAGDVQRAEGLVAEGASAGARDEHGRTPLHLAVLAGNAELVGQLLGAGADLRALDAGHMAPLHWAAALGRTELVRALLRHGADPRLHQPEQSEAPMPAPLGATPLHWAAGCGHPEVAAALLDAGAEIGATDSQRLTALQWAASVSHVQFASRAVDTTVRMRPEALRPKPGSSEKRLAAARLLLDRGAAPDATDPDGGTPLLDASRSGETEMVRLLLQRGAKVEGADRRVDSPLVGAAEAGACDVARLLLQRGADPNAVAKQPDRAMYGGHRTPLQAAAAGGHTEMIRILLRHGADATATTHEGQSAAELLLQSAFWDDGAACGVMPGMTGAPPAGRGEARLMGGLPVAPVLPEHPPAGQEQAQQTARALLQAGAPWSLGAAAALGDTERVCEFVRAGAGLDAPSPTSYAPLNWAIAYGRTNVVQLLLDCGATPNESAGAVDGLAPIVQAVTLGDSAMVKLLMARGADAAAHDTHGQTLLQIAAREGYTDLLVQFADLGLDVNATGRPGIGGEAAPPVFLAAEEGHTAAVEALLHRGADPAPPRTDGRSALLSAVYGRHIEAVKLLLDRGMDLTRGDCRGRAALHWAAQWGGADITRLLLDRGADVNARSADRSTPLHLALGAYGYRDLPTVELLLARGADRHARDAAGNTPLSLARRLGDDDLLRVLEGKVGAAAERQR